MTGDVCPGGYVVTVLAVSPDHLAFRNTTADTGQVCELLHGTGKLHLVTVRGLLSDAMMIGCRVTQPSVFNGSMSLRLSLLLPCPDHSLPQPCISLCQLNNIKRLGGCSFCMRLQL